FGNLAQRTLAFVTKNCEGRVPAIAEGLLAQDQGLLNAGDKLAETLEGLYKDFKFHSVLEAIVVYANKANAYIDVEAPWTLRKTNPARMNSVLYTLMEAIRV